MQRYLIQLRGDNFLLDLDGEHEKFSLQATRIIKAGSSAEAERIALIKFHQELNQSPHIVKNTPDAPRVIVDQIEELKFFQIVSKKSVRGFQFLAEEKD